MTPIRVVYIAGPFRGRPVTDQWDQQQKIHRAAVLAHQVWAAGFVALCPHLNTAPFQGSLDDAIWLEGDLELLRRCDAVLMTEDWRMSVGAQAEHDYAQAHGMPVFYTLDVLCAAAKDKEPAA